MNEKKEKTKFYSIISYIYILWIVGFFEGRDDPIVKFHVNQGIIFSIFLSGLWIVMRIICSILLSISKIFAIFTSLFQLLFVCFLITYISIGIYNAITEKQRPLPIIGGLFDFLK